jgi:hypothetical protein
MYLQTCARFDKDAASGYARSLVQHLFNYRDKNTAARGFFCQYSIIARSMGEAQQALGLAALSLLDGVGFMLEMGDASLALLRVCEAALDIRNQNRRSAGTIPEMTYVLSERINRSDEQVRQFARKMVKSDLDGLKAVSSRRICKDLALALSGPLKAAAVEIGLDLKVKDTVTLGDLEYLADQQ